VRASRTDDLEARSCSAIVSPPVAAGDQPPEELLAGSHLFERDVFVRLVA
jgi:hypothetical protein